MSLFGSTVTVEMYLNGSWTDVTSYVRQDPGIDITHGVQSEGAVADAGQCTFLVNNSDGRFSPRNTAGAYYPYLTRGTPVRVKVNSAVRFLGELVEFPVKWGPHPKNAWVPLTAAGVLRRLSHANEVDSPLTSTAKQRANSPADIPAWWALEDRPGTTVPQATAWKAAAGRPVGATIIGAPVWQGAEAFPMSKPIPTWKNAQGVFYVPFVSATAWMAQAVITFPATGLTGGEELFRVDDVSTASSWRLLYSPGTNGTLLVQVLDADGAEVEVEVISEGGGGCNGTTRRVSIQAQNSGANVEYFASVTGVGSTGTQTINSVQLGGVARLSIGTGTIAIPVDVGIGQIGVGTSYTALSNTDFDDAIEGFNGESVEQRATRLDAITGVTINVTSGNVQPVELGIQPTGSLLDVLRGMEKADGGILTDTLTALEVTYRTRWSRYNGKSGNSLALNYASGHILSAEPVDDDSQLANDVTVNREYGSSARVEKLTGALSVADYPSGVGRYSTSDTVGTYDDDQLVYVAGWRLGLGTYDAARWPAITVDLVANSSLVSSVNALRPGDEVTISNLPAVAGASTAVLQVVGWREILTAATRTITLNCVPGEQWRVFQLDHSTYGKLDLNRLAL